VAILSQTFNKNLVKAEDMEKEQGTIQLINLMEVS
jgi:hypothetical protein